MSKKKDNFQTIMETMNRFSKLPDALVKLPPSVLKTWHQTITEYIEEARPEPGEGKYKVVKFRDPDKPGCWYLTDFTMEQLERHIQMLQAQLAELKKELDIVEGSYQMAMQERSDIWDEYDKLRDKTTWIPVTERLPDLLDGINNDISEDVFLYDPTDIPHRRIGKRWLYNDGVIKENRWRVNPPYRAVNGKNVTHWMPLPEPPEVKN